MYWVSSKRRPLNSVFWSLESDPPGSLGGAGSQAALPAASRGLDSAQSVGGASQGLKQGRDPMTRIF